MNNNNNINLSIILRLRSRPNLSCPLALTPKIRVMYNSDLRRHYHCPGAGKWHVATIVIFDTPSETIAALVNFKHQFWCEFFLKPLFFPFAVEIIHCLQPTGDVTDIIYHYI